MILSYRVPTMKSPDYGDVLNIVVFSGAKSILHITGVQIPT
jgi:hypothetical protein